MNSQKNSRIASPGKSYFGGKRGSGSFQQIISEVPAGVDTVVIPFLGDCPIYEFFENQPVKLIGIERSSKVISDYHPRGNVINGCGISWLSGSSCLRDPGTVVYADPPYLLESRKDSRPRYDHELSKSDHIRLLRILKKASCRVIISHYSCSLYDVELKNWRSKQWDVSTRAGKAVEKLWMNFPDHVDRFTYDYVGRDKTERQRIKRKKQRWLKALQRMPSIEAKSILSFLNQNYPDQK